jgi:hypothetical protein
MSNPLALFSVSIFCSLICLPPGHSDSRSRAFIFDIDGTLVDSNELHVESWDRAFLVNFKIA